MLRADLAQEVGLLLAAHDVDEADAVLEADLVQHLPEIFAVERSAAPVSRPRSEGLIGVASTRTTTSSGPGSGVGTFNSEISSSPLFLINERSCRPLLASLMMFLSISFFLAEASLS